MKKIILILAVFLLVFIFATNAEPSIRVGKTGLLVHLSLGSNGEDSIGQLGAGIEYGLISHLSLGLGYVYVDGRHPLQADGLDLYVKAYFFDKKLDFYGKIGAQIYNNSEPGLVSTYKLGFEWQSPVLIFLAVEGGAELENGDWGDLFGSVIGIRI